MLFPNFFKIFFHLLNWSRDSDATQDVNYIWGKDNTGLFFFFLMCGADPYKADVTLTEL